MTSQLEGNIEQLIQRYRILSGELIDAYQMKGLSVHEFNDRRKRVELLEERLQNVIDLKRTQNISPIGSLLLNSDLPVFGDSSVSELSAIDRSLDDYILNGRQVVASLKQVEAELNTAQFEGFGWFRGVFRLSSLKQKISKVQQALQLTRKKRVALEQFLKGLSNSEENKSIRDDLIDTFKELELATKRVNLLGDRVETEHKQNRHQIEWLQKVEEARLAENSSINLPKPTDISALKQDIGLPTNDAIDATKDRLVLARKMIHAIEKAPFEGTKLTTNKEEMVSLETDLRSKKKRLQNKRRNHQL